MAKIHELFQQMIASNASDLHLTSGAPPFLRVHGEMKTLSERAFSAEECQAFIFEILTEKQKKLFVEHWELDCSYTIPNTGRFRVNVFMQRKGLGAVFRIIPEKIKTIEELGLSPDLLNLIDVPKGLILVTGATGSGKSTTLAALIDHINRTEHSHILTIEDPIEFVHRNQLSLINQREVSSHTKSFANALRAALREDPDIILVGELRDLETIQLAITAAETGHLVFGTLHTNSAAKTIDRIIDVFPEAKQEQIRAMLAESLRGVIAQVLLPRADGEGRIGVNEVLVNTKAVANLIREGKTFQIPSTMQVGRSQGMATFESAVTELLRKRIIHEHDAMEYMGKSSLSAVGGPNAAGSSPPPIRQPTPITKKPA